MQNHPRASRPHPAGALALMTCKSNSHPKEACWRILPIPLASPQRNRETFPIQIRLSKCLLNIPIHASDPTLLAASKDRKTKHPRVAYIFDVVHLFFQLIGGPAIHDHFLLLVGIRSAHHTVDNTLRKLPRRFPMAWFWRLGKGRKWEKEHKSHKHSTNNGYPLMIKQVVPIPGCLGSRSKRVRRPVWHLLVILDLAWAGVARPLEKALITHFYQVLVHHPHWEEPSYSIFSSSSDGFNCLTNLMVWNVGSWHWLSSGSETVLWRQSWPCSQALRERGGVDTRSVVSIYEIFLESQAGVVWLQPQRISTLCLAGL